MLLKKNLIEKFPDPNDARSYSIKLTKEGKAISANTAQFSNKLFASIIDLPQTTKDQMLEGLLHTIGQLNKRSVISLQRMCKHCRFLENKDGGHYCSFLEQPLGPTELRIDCPEFEEKT